MNAELSSLLAYAEQKLMLDARDADYATGRLLALVGKTEFCRLPADSSDIDDILSRIFCELEGADRAVLGERLMDAVMLRPSEFERIFWQKYAKSPKTATDWAYAYAVDSNYVKAGALAKNIRWHAENGLEITVNLSKPEKDNKDLLRQLTEKSPSYPKCALCRENEGYERPGFSRANLRTVSLRLAGEDWFWQYSPYAYFGEHGVAVRREHVPMTLDGQTACRLFDFVDLFPHYFIGNNAPLPRVGGSILMHDHFQGGREMLPMQRAGVAVRLKSARFPRVRVGLLDWHSTAFRLSGAREDVESLADLLARAWQTFRFPEADILPFTDAPHSTASFIARREKDGYVLDVLLRNNRCDEEHPDGIFHAHRDKHHIKKESIGLIEAMGLFILPARIQRQLAVVTDCIQSDSVRLPADMGGFYPMTERLVRTHGGCTRTEAERAVKREVEKTCKEILADIAVFKPDDTGERALCAFLEAAELKKEIL